MVDLFAVGLPALFAAHLLPPVRALQSRGVAVACPGDRARPRGAGYVAPWRNLAGSHRRRHPCHLLAVRRVAYLVARYDTINWAASYFAAGFAVEALLLVWTGLMRNWLSLRPGRDVAGAAGLCIFIFALFGRPAARSAVAAGRDLRHCAGSNRRGDAGRSHCGRSHALRASRRSAALVRDQRCDLVGHAIVGRLAGAGRCAAGARSSLLEDGLAVSASFAGLRRRPRNGTLMLRGGASR